MAPPTKLLQLYYGPVVTYCIVYHYTKRATLVRLLANKGLAIYLNRYFVIPPWYYLVVTFCDRSRSNLRSGRYSPLLQNPLWKDTPRYFQPQKAEHDPWLYLAQGPQYGGQLANQKSTDEPMSPQYKGCYVIWKEQMSWRKIKTRAINICQSKPPLEYMEDSEEDKAPL